MSLSSSPPPGVDVPPADGEPAGGRDGRGRFAKGNPGGPGNPFARRTAAVRVALLARLGEDKVGAIVDRLVELALGGNVAAARLALSYSVGKPAPAVDPDTLDQQEWKVCRTSSISSDEMADAMGVPLAFATPVVRDTRSSIARSLSSQLGERLAEMAERDAEEREEDEEDDRLEAEEEARAAQAPPAPAGAADQPSMAAILAVLKYALPASAVADVAAAVAVGGAEATLPLPGRGGEGAPHRRAACPPVEQADRHQTRKYSEDGGQGATGREDGGPGGGA